MTILKKQYNIFLWLEHTGLVQLQVCMITTVLTHAELLTVIFHASSLHFVTIKFVRLFMNSELYVQVYVLSQ